MIRLSTSYKQKLARSFLLLLAAVEVTLGQAQELPFSRNPANLRASSIHWVTNAAQFRALANADYLDECDFHLTGVVTLVDAKRDLVVMQDAEAMTVLSGPAWWTWEKAATLMGILLITLALALAWIHLLRRRLERHRAAQLAFSQQVLRKLEEERRRIAVNLHDSLGQTLLVIKHRAMSAIESLTEEQPAYSQLEGISTVTSQAIEEIRRITRGLHPYQLDRLGLTQAIRASVNEASENGSILFASRIEDIDGLFDKDGEIHVYRIAQEAITNVVKHSAATEATVVLKKAPTAVFISIRDNGRGFDLAKLSSHPQSLGFGLSGLTERVRILKGTVAIDSHLGAGTSLSVEVPLNNS